MTIPVLALGGQFGVGELVEQFARRYGTNITGSIISNSGHWIFEEQPEQSAAEIIAFLQQ